MVIPGHATNLLNPQDVSFLLSTLGNDLARYWSKGENPPPPAKTKKESYLSKFPPSPSKERDYKQKKKKKKGQGSVYYCKKCGVFPS